MYFVVPDDAIANMSVSANGTAYTLENHRPDSEAMLSDLTEYVETEEGMEETCNYVIKEYIRLYSKANAGVLIIGALYVSTVFVCMALAILSVKTLSALEDERRRFAILYRLGADTKMQKTAIQRQTGAFFLMPFTFPILMTVPIGIIFKKVYEIWILRGLSGIQAMQTAAVIALVITGIYVLYYFITYRIACNHVICSGTEDQNSY